jgi:beta-RFAP synthase
MSVRVVAPCRLHFGLFHVPVDGLTHHPDGRPVRKFGGLGLMIDQPCVVVTPTRTHHDVATGPLFDRAQRFMDELRDCGAGPTCQRIETNGPSEHIGLGVGTTLGLAVASVLYPAYWACHQDFPVQTLAARVRRGRRSGIGTYGFRHGGFIADDGKVADHELPQLGVRLDFPSSWRVALIRPPVKPIWHGDREHAVFDRTRLADKALSLTDRLRSLAYDTVVPAVRNADFETFATSIHEFNRLAGVPFHDDQGGPYASPEVACVIDELMEMGAVGVGQSSWGPTVFAFAPDADEAEHLANRARDRFSSATDVTVTAANNTGARLETT